MQPSPEDLRLAKAGNVRIFGPAKAQFAGHCLISLRGVMGRPYWHEDCSGYVV